MAKAIPPQKPASKKSSPDMSSSLRMMNALPDPVIAFDSMLKISLGNVAAQNFFKLSKKQLLGKYMVELLGAKHAVFEAVEEAVRKNMSITLRDASVNGHPVGSVIITVVERQALYLMIIRQRPAMQLANKWNEQTMPSLKSGHLLANEIEKPVAEISAAAKILLSSRLGAKDRQQAKRIVAEAEKIQGLLKEFNIFHETPPRQQKKLSLHDVLTQATRIAQETYGDKIEITEYFDPLLPDIRGNFEHLLQAKLNLIKNAAEAFANKKGQISIRTFYDHAAGAHADHDEKRPLRIEIEDNGQGITPEIINRIFHPYFTTKKGGHGLGLPITSKIVYEHGGTINVNSQPGKTVFRINLPVPPVPPVKPARR